MTRRRTLLVGALVLSVASIAARAAVRESLTVTRQHDAGGRLLEERTWRSGHEEGTHRGWWPNGRPRFAYEYHDGLLEGTSREWYPSGALLREQRYHAGHEAGLQRMYWEDGRVRASYVVRDGRRYGLLGAKGCVTRGEGRTSKALPYYDSTLVPRWLDTEADVERAHRVGDFHLVDESGRVVSRRDVDGRVYVAAFFYTSCQTLCPTVRAQLGRVRQAFAGDDGVRILSHTVIPDVDGPRRLADYAARNRVDGEQWRLLTGSRAELERLARDAYFVELADSSGATQGTLRHTETLVLVDGAGHVRGMYDGSLAYEVTQLIADIGILRRGR